ncbi:hypothetical protein NPIL_162521 [Nephila pilipes]|uniref:Uncharacterized protein n=1 Tax=Nephila pilipes TaxID=299642 RepID=A0A8X6PEV9_NEPPI|nr:hypothetical protein NPIL_162521 [Nephila pilipes]
MCNGTSFDAMDGRQKRIEKSSIDFKSFMNEGAEEERSFISTLIGVGAKKGMRGIGSIFTLGRKEGDLFHHNGTLMMKSVESSSDMMERGENNKKGKKEREKRY